MAATTDVRKRWVEGKLARLLEHQPGALERLNGIFCESFDLPPDPAPSPAPVVAVESDDSHSDEAPCSEADVMPTSYGVMEGIDVALTTI